MTPATPDAPSPAAVTAFLRGLDRRARLFASVQAGDALAAQHALGVVARVFTGEAGQWPIAEWPRQYWRLLLAAPSLRKPPSQVSTPQLPGIGRLAVEARAAVLLHLVAALDDVDAAAARVQEKGGDHRHQAQRHASPEPAHASVMAGLGIC